jgi:methylmalonyl-CoA/ethylmalonyl-CoA epimerase
MSEGLFPHLLVHHACLSVRDLDESIAWWGEIFGFDLDFKFDVPPIGARGAFIKRQGFRIELFEILGSHPTPVERQTPNSDLRTQGCKHFCFSVENVQQAAEILHAKGVKLVGIVRGHGEPMIAEDDPQLDAKGAKSPAMAIFLVEPSGALVELVRRADFSE